MEYGGNQMNTNNKLCAVDFLVMKELPHNGYENLYQAMCVNYDWDGNDIALAYNAEELALEVV